MINNNHNNVVHVTQSLYNHPMNWKQILNELKGYGYTTPKLAKLLNISTSTLTELRRHEGRDPAYTTGKALLDILAEANKQEKDN